MSIRETIQNSLDARSNDSQAVEVRCTFHEGALFLGTAQVWDYFTGLIPHLSACGLDLDGIDPNEPCFLVVEDCTHGLGGNPETKEPTDFCFFWHVVGRSGKDRRQGRALGPGENCLSQFVPPPLQRSVRLSRARKDGLDLPAMKKLPTRPVMISVVDSMPSAIRHMNCLRSQYNLDDGQRTFTAMPMPAGIMP